MTTNALAQKRHEDALYALELAIQRKAELPLLARLASELAVVSQRYGLKVDVPRILRLWADLAPRFPFMRDPHHWNKPANDVELSANLWEALKLTYYPAQDGYPEGHTVGFSWSMIQNGKAVAAAAAAAKAAKADPAPAPVAAAAPEAAPAVPLPPEAAPTLDAYLKATGRADLIIRHVADAAELLAADAQRTGKPCAVTFARAELSCAPGETAAHALMQWSIEKEGQRDLAHERELSNLRAELAKARAELEALKAEAGPEAAPEAADVQHVRTLALVALDDMDALERAAKAVRQRLGSLVLLRPA